MCAKELSDSKDYSVEEQEVEEVTLSGTCDITKDGVRYSGIYVEHVPQLRGHSQVGFGTFTPSSGSNRFMVTVKVEDHKWSVTPDASWLKVVTLTNTIIVSDQKNHLVCPVDGGLVKKLTEEAKKKNELTK